MKGLVMKNSSSQVYPFPPIPTQAWSQGQSLSVVSSVAVDFCHSFFSYQLWTLLPTSTFQPPKFLPTLPNIAVLFPQLFTYAISNICNIYTILNLDLFPLTRVSMSWLLSLSEKKISAPACSFPSFSSFCNQAGPYGAFLGKTAPLMPSAYLLFVDKL